MYTNDLYISYLFKFATRVFDFIGKPEPQKYADAVNTLHKPEKMLEILEKRIEAIENDPDISRSEKEARKDAALSQYSAEEIKLMLNCADIIDRDAEKKSENASKIIVGILLGALSTGAACGLVSGIKNNPGQLHIVPRRIGN